ncbi:MAG: hypothetical protein JXA09_05060 [Anaerolineae bacterium]|nr:hypothetical protein [Anaerolineae bacterium]
MAFEYPDVMNDHLEASRRYESAAVQYLATAPREPTPAGQVLDVRLVLQSVMDVPVKVWIHVALPALDRRLRRLPQPLFAVFQPDIHLTLSHGEVAQLVIPLHVSEHVPPGAYDLSIVVRSEAEQGGTRVRPRSGARRIGEIKIRYPQGLGIAQIGAWGYESTLSEEQVLALHVGEAGESSPEVELKPAFSSLWTPDDWEIFARARQEANDRSIYALPTLTPEALFVRFMEQSQALFAASGVTLHLGEAIFLGKILTYTTRYMLAQPEWQECLLVPMYAYAQLTDESSDDALWLVTELGYTHVIELAIALSFALVEEVLQREIWDREEQRAVREFVAESLSEGKPLPTEFLYLPLILGALVAADESVVEGEEVGESLRLLSTSKAARAELFAEEELRDLGDAFDRLFARQARRRV